MKKITDNTHCDTCDGMLGVLTTRDELEHGEHKLCRSLHASDWAALRPYFTGNLSGVQMGSV